MARKVTVVVYAGNLHFRDFEFEQDAIAIGRRPDCDIYLKHASVSGEHARIDLREMTVTDLGSTNGTFCGGQRISSARLQFEKSIYIEPYRIIVSLSAGKRQAKHSDTVVLSPDEFVAQGAAGDGPETSGSADPPHPPAGGGGWLEGIPQWIPVASLAVVIGVTLLLIMMLLSGDS